MSAMATDDSGNGQITAEEYWQNIFDPWFSDEGFQWLLLTSESREYSANVVDVRELSF